MYVRLGHKLPYQRLENGETLLHAIESVVSAHASLTVQASSNDFLPIVVPSSAFGPLPRFPASPLPYFPSSPFIP
jgi:hypothetical protein